MSSLRKCHSSSLGSPYKIGRFTVRTLSCTDVQDFLKEKRDSKAQEIKPYQVGRFTVAPPSENLKLNPPPGLSGASQPFQRGRFTITTISHLSKRLSSCPSTASPSSNSVRRGRFTVTASPSPATDSQESELVEAFFSDEAVAPATEAYQLSIEDFSSLQGEEDTCDSLPKTSLSLEQEEALQSTDSLSWQEQISILKQRLSQTPPFRRSKKEINSFLVFAQVNYAIKKYQEIVHQGYFLSLSTKLFALYNLIYLLKDHQREFEANHYLRYAQALEKELSDFE